MHLSDFIKKNISEPVKRHCHGIAAARMDAHLNVSGWMSKQMGGVRLDDFIFLGKNWSTCIMFVNELLFNVYEQITF